MKDRVLIAGVGNVFFGDDAFGPEVARRIAEQELPEGVTVRDYGIRGLHLAYDLLDPPELLVLVDALPHHTTPGSTCILEPDIGVDLRAQTNGHGMDLPTVFSMVRSMGGTLPRTLIVGCEPADLSQRMGLTPCVAHAVDAAMDLVHQIIENALDPTPPGSRTPPRSET